MDMADHTPVLLAETVHWLAPRSGGRYLDGTLGFGGHSLGLMESAGGPIEIAGIDRDEAALKYARERLHSFGGSLHAFMTTYSRFPEVLAELGWKDVDGALLDLGVSSLHLDDASRGFSFMHDGPLDMRMGTAEGRQTARTLVNRASCERLKTIIQEYGEEPMAGRIARRIVEARAQAPIETTLELARIVVSAYPAKRRALSRNHPATKTFQALRIAVNGEMEELKSFLEVIPTYLAPGGRVAVIAFHSLEDRMVKLAFRKEAKGCVCPERAPLCTCNRRPTLTILTKKPIVPTQREQDQNPRSRSAKLRVAQRIPGQGEAV